MYSIMGGAQGIQGSGSGFSGGGGRFEPRRGDMARFCRDRRVGDLVSGIFLRFGSPGTGWVDLEEGGAFLALLPEDGFRPAIGQKLLFRIDAMAPELTLRLLSPEEAEKNAGSGRFYRRV